MRVLKALETTLISLCLPILIFFGATLALINSGEKFFAVILIISGVLAVIKDVRTKWGVKNG